MDERIYILILEGFPADVKLAESELRIVLDKYRIRVVDNREDFIEALSSFNPDLIISDYKTPAFDGLAALQLTREKYPFIPFIILTESMNEEIAVACMKAGADDYLIKRDIKRLGSAVKSVIEKKRIERERHRRTMELFENEERFRAVVENSHDGIFIIDENHEFIYANGKSCEILGRPIHQIIGRHFKEFLDEEGKEVVQKRYFTRGRKGGLQESSEFNLIRTNGQKRQVEASAITVKNSSGNKWTIAHALDITERKQAELERERLLSAIQQTSEAIIITDTGGTIQYVNPAFEKTSGYSHDEVIGKNPRILKSGEHDKRFYRNLWRTISKGKTWEGRIVNKRKDGRLYSEMVTISPILDHSGRIVNYVGVKRDITEEIRLEAQLQQAQKMESIGRLAGGVAHDFNNMLSVIFGYSEMALRKLTSGDPLYSDLNEILKAADRAREITRQLLAFARKQTISPKVLDLNQTVENILKMLRRLIGEDIDLTWIPGWDLGAVKIDPTQVDQILANLCVNARDAITGIGKITIETQNVSFDKEYCASHPGFKPGDFVLLAVSDNGCGMDKQTLSKVFEPFFTTKVMGKGTGLGMATVYGIVKQNNGFINVYSEPDKGTQVKVYLPRHKGKLAEEVRKERVEIPQGRGETILLVEDDLSILQLGKTMLESLDYKVLDAPTPNQALNLAAKYEGKIHLLLTDVTMPEMNGQELAGKVKSANPEVKVIYISGYTANVIAHHGILGEGVNFLAKPFSIRDMATKVREVLDKPLK